MKTIRIAALVGVVLLASGCAGEQPIVVQHGRGYGGSYGGSYGQPDTLQQTARGANSVESIVSSIARVGRLVAGGY